MASPLPLWLALAGCSFDQTVVEIPAGPEPGAPATTSEPVPSTPTEELPSPYVVEVEEREPELTMEELAEGIRAGLAAIFDVDLAEGVDLYERFEDLGDDHSFDGNGNFIGGCPVYYNYYTSYDYWYAYCSSQAGATFNGYALLYRWAGPSGRYEYHDTFDFYLYGKISDPSGYTVNGSVYGYHYDYTDTYYGRDNTYLRSYGEMSSDHPDAPAWVRDRVAFDLTISSAFEPGGRSVTLDGALSGFDGPVDTIVAEDVSFMTASWGADCDDEPAGNLAVRGHDGIWYDVEFQGAGTTGFTFDPLCDACGEVFVEGKRLGVTCPDLSPLTTWSQRPWQ